MFALSVISLLLACGDKDAGTDTGPGPDDGGSVGGGTSDGGTSDGGTGDGGTGDGGTGDGGTTDGGTTDGGASTGPDLDYSVGFELVSEDTDALAPLDAVVQTWSITDAFARPFTTPDGDSPSFVVVRARSPAGSPAPVLIALHGGSTDVDDEIPEGANGRCTAAYGLDQATSNATSSAMLGLAVAAGAVVIVPANAFCDGWAGLGPDDPVDPTHAGSFLVHAALGWLFHGQDELIPDPERVTLAGFSLGATGVAWVANHEAAITALVFDSGAPDFIRYSLEEDYSSYPLETRALRGEHIMGGPPYEDDGVTASAWHDRYIDHSLALSLTDGRLSLPVFAIVNAQDGLSPPVMHEDAEETLSTALDPVGHRWTFHDVDHESPVHVQVNSPGSTYAGHGAVRFALGHQVAYVEAEAGLGEVGTVTAAEGASGGLLRSVSPREGAGVLLEASLPEDATGDVSVAVFTDVGGTGTDDVVLRLFSGEAEVASRTFGGGSATFDGPGLEAAMTVITVGTLSGSVSGAGRVVVETQGSADVQVDVIVVDW